MDDFPPMMANALTQTVIIQACGFADNMQFAAVLDPVEDTIETIFEVAESVFLNKGIKTQLRLFRVREELLRTSKLNMFALSTIYVFNTIAQNDRDPVPSIVFPKDFDQPPFSLVIRSDNRQQVYNTIREHLNFSKLEGFVRFDVLLNEVTIKVVWCFNGAHENTFYSDIVFENEGKALQINTKSDGVNDRTRVTAEARKLFDSSQRNGYDHLTADWAAVIAKVKSYTFDP